MVEMGDFTVGQVSGIINLWVIIVQHTLPPAFVLILVAFLENENSAVTWSVVGRTLQASMWPSILSADSAATRGVRKRVFFITTLSTIALMILAIAGVVTPLGLSEEIVPSFTKPAVFQYLKDTSTFGQGTQSRSGYVFSRCGFRQFGVCRGVFHSDAYFANTSRPYEPKNASIGTNIPVDVAEIFTSATSGRGNLMSGPLDVQHRVFSNSKHPDTAKASNHTSRSQDNFYTTGVAATIRSVILDDGFVLVEGLIVDAKNGGVGFRNHSAPLNLPYGGTWEESLLWLEPVSQCLDSNLTIDFTILSDSDIGDKRLTDRGGWVNLAPDHTDSNYADSQLDPQLWQRIYGGAWTTNSIVASFLNVTRNMTNMGKSYRRLPGSYGNRTGYETTRITVGDINADWIRADLPKIDLGPRNLTDANSQCVSDGGTRMPNITKIGIKCSTIFGTAKRTDGGDTGRMHDVGSNWSRPIYTCATAIKASVKVVTFSMNGTHILENLRVDKVVPKNYSSVSVMPVWAIENSGMDMNDSYPFWGIVDQKYKDAPQLWTIQREHLWLPSVYRTAALARIQPSDSLSLLTVPGQALGMIRTNDDYSGKRNFALLSKWRKLSETQNSVALIPNLIWTDIVANNLVGTKSVPSAYGVTERDEQPSAGTLSVDTYGKRITYRPVFAIPALTILVVWVTSLFLALLMLVASRVSLAAVQKLINHTSTGRSVTNLLYPETCAQSASTKIWVRGAGKKKIGFVGLGKEGSDGGERAGGGSATIVEEVGELEGMLSEGMRLRFGEVEEHSAQTPVGVMFQSGYSREKKVS
ncbi:hypothetical protein HOY80DRAFT_1085610 [Tuber brumale]|nr:hypothetical protein HOY80DRAFT_1085610 [Tuber brumale]